MKTFREQVRQELLKQDGMDDFDWSIWRNDSQWFFEMRYHRQVMRSMHPCRFFETPKTVAAELYSKAIKNGWEETEDY